MKILNILSFITLFILFLTGCQTQKNKNISYDTQDIVNKNIEYAVKTSNPETDSSETLGMIAYAKISKNKDYLDWMFDYKAEVILVGKNSQIYYIDLENDPKDTGAQDIASLTYSDHPQAITRSKMRRNWDHLKIGAIFKFQIPNNPQKISKQYISTSVNFVKQGYPIFEKNNESNKLYLESPFAKLNK